jgi:hypothetical protein
MTLPIMNEIITDSIPIIAIMQTYRMAIPQIKKKTRGESFHPARKFPSKTWSQIKDLLC